MDWKAFSTQWANPLCRNPITAADAIAMDTPGLKRHHMTKEPSHVLWCHLQEMPRRIRTAIAIKSIRKPNPFFPCRVNEVREHIINIGKLILAFAMKLMLIHNIERDWALFLERGRREKEDVLQLVTRLS